MIATLYFLSVVSTALAWMLTRRKGEHRPIAVALTVGLLSDVSVKALRAFYLNDAIARLGVNARWTGVPRFAGVVAHALFLAWPAALAGAAIVVFLRRRPWAAGIGYIVALVAIVAVHPIAGDGSLGRMLAAGSMLGLLVSVGCALTWYLSPSKVPTSTAQATLFLILAGELAMLVGSWRIGAFDHWYISQVLYLLLYIIVAILQGGFLWQSRSGSR